MRGAYLVLWRPPGDEAAAAALGVEARLAGEAAWSCVSRTGALSLWRQADSALGLWPLPGGIGLGAPISAIGNAADPACDGRGARDVAERLVAQFWGPYVAVWGDAGAAHVLRSASGEHDVLTWRSPEGLGVVASDLMTVPGWLRPGRHALNWDRITQFVAQPRAGLAVSLFDDVVAVGPGELCGVGGGRPAELIWRPSRFIAADPRQDSGGALLAAVDHCTSALTTGRASMLVELSGGFDSAVVAGALSAGGAATRVAAWINRVGDRREGDERDYAQKVTEAIGMPLTCVEKPRGAFNFTDFEDLQATTWPALNGVDAPRDRDMAERLVGCGADAIVSGQGGDAVFFQMATSWLAADAVRRWGPLAAGTQTVAALARRMRKPVWRVLQEARVALSGRARLPSSPSPILTPEAAAYGAVARHPWERDVEGAPLVKQLQVGGLANAHLVRADCRRRRHGDILFPLLGQPVVELCLSITAETLAVGVGDRPFARRALAARAPTEILARRRKGALSAYYGQRVARSREVLFEYLHDGCLAEARVLDRAAVRRMLDPAQLIWSTRPLEVLNAAATEAWVRYWQGRVPDSLQAHR